MNLTVDAEAARIAVLRNYKILDTEPEQFFDDIAARATVATRCPIALISLVDRNRQWLKARSNFSIAQTSRSISFCTHAIESREPFVVLDATADHRFRNNPFVTGPWHVRFYAAAPLESPSGALIGTLCVLDRQPRTAIDPGHVAFLQRSSRRIIAALELRLLAGGRH